MEPTEEQIERAAGVLGYFVTPWNLPLNPEDLEELAYAVLAHHDSTDSRDEIGAAVEARIAEHRRIGEARDAGYRSQGDEDSGASAERHEAEAAPRLKR